MSLERKLETLKSNLASLGKVVIGFSGGVDSTFLARVSVQVLGASNVWAVMGISPSVSAHQKSQAQRLAEEIGVELHLLNTEEMHSAGYVSNPVNRCFFCKEELFGKLKQFAQARHMTHVLDGTNLDDLSDFRPGRKAALEAGITSPLAEANLTKQDIRDLSRALGLSSWNEPSSPCLSSRFPYGTPIRPEALRQVEQAEDILRQQGFREFRVRFFEKFAKLEFDSDGLERMRDPALKQNVFCQLQTLGFETIEMDSEPFQSGRLNKFKMTV